MVLPSNKRVLKIIFRTTISVFLIVFLLTLIDRSIVSEFVFSAKPMPLFIGFLLTTLSCVLRAKRFQVSTIVSPDIHLKDYFSITCFYNLASSLFPSGSGEISYPLLMKKHFNVEIGYSMTSLLVSRMFQILCLIIFFIISIACLEILSFKLSYSTLFILVAIVICIAWFLFKANKIIAFILKKIPSKSYCASIKKNMLKMQISIEELIKTDRYFVIMLLSLTISIFNITTLYFVVRAFDCEITFMKAVFALSICQISSILPVHGIAKLGTYESIAAVAFILVDIPKDIAITLGFAIHFSGIIFQIILVVFAYTLIRHRGKQH